VVVAEIDAAPADGTVQAIHAAGGTAEAVALDVGDDGAVAAAVARCQERFGGQDAYFNNAATGGGDRPSGPTRSASTPSSA
jgi:NAD(P)-dependent dehydrogenase (short-subunit alcohol dehydrogenase family)